LNPDQLAPHSFELASNAEHVYRGGMSSPTPSQALRDGRDVIRALATRHRTANPRVFGSVLVGRDDPDSDLDLLVEPTSDTTLFDLGGLQDALEEALRVRVDVKTPLDLPPHIRARVLKQAVAV
jgi:predicted nucleotidyltransferase